MSSNQPPRLDPRTQGTAETNPSGLDLAGALHLVETALAAAGVATTERERLACAKTLLRLVPGPSTHAGGGDFPAVLRELGRG